MAGEAGIPFYSGLSLLLPSVAAGCRCRHPSQLAGSCDHSCLIIAPSHGSVPAHCPALPRRLPRRLPRPAAACSQRRRVCGDVPGGGGCSHPLPLQDRSQEQPLHHLHWWVLRRAVPCRAVPCGWQLPTSPSNIFIGGRSWIKVGSNGCSGGVLLFLGRAGIWEGEARTARGSGTGPSVASPSLTFCPPCLACLASPALPPLQTRLTPSARRATTAPPTRARRSGSRACCSC